MAKKKIGKKVNCALCKAQYNGFCTIKRVSVSLNKKRCCDKYVFDESKIRAGVPIPTKRITFKEKEVLRKERKEQLKELKTKLQKQGVDDIGKINVTPVFNNEKHPLTGDLSRFTTTGSGDEKAKLDQRKGKKV